MHGYHDSSIYGYWYSAGKHATKAARLALLLAIADACERNGW